MGCTASSPVAVLANATTQIAHTAHADDSDVSIPSAHANFNSEILSGSTINGISSRDLATKSPSSPSCIDPDPIEKQTSSIALQGEVVTVTEPYSDSGRTHDDGPTKTVNKYTLLGEIGRGAFGKVRKCIDETSGDFRAAKILRKSVLKRKRVGRFGSALDNVAREIAIWKKLQQRNIVTLYDVIDDEDGDKMYLMSEFVNGGCAMPDELNVKPLSVPHARALMCQLLDAIAYLHFHNVAHRDIKPGNLLVNILPPGNAESAAANDIEMRRQVSAAPANRDRDSAESEVEPKPSPEPDSRTSRFEGIDASRLVLKVTDFGVSQVFDDGDDTSRSTSGTASFLAPEMLIGGAFSSKKVDLWAIGVTLFMFLFGHPPFVAENLTELYDMIKTSDISWPSGMGHGDAQDKAREGDKSDAVQRPQSMHVDERALAENLILGLLTRDPSTRMTLEQARVHPFLQWGEGWLPPPSLPQHSISVTEEEVQAAISNVVKFRALVKAAVLGKKKLAGVRSRIAAATAFNPKSYKVKESGNLEYNGHVQLSGFDVHGAPVRGRSNSEARAGLELATGLIVEGGEEDEGQPGPLPGAMDVEIFVDSESESTRSTHSNRSPAQFGLRTRENSAANSNLYGVYHTEGTIVTLGSAADVLHPAGYRSPRDSPRSSTPVFASARLGPLHGIASHQYNEGSHEGSYGMQEAAGSVPLINIKDLKPGQPRYEITAQ